MSFNVIGSLRVYLDAPRKGDPRTFLAVLYEGEERVHPFDADGVSTDEAPLEALIRSAKGALVVASEKDRLWAGSFFGAPPSRVLPLPPSEEARLRLLAGRARKASPPGREPVGGTLSSDDPLYDDLGALLSDHPVQEPAVEMRDPERALPLGGDDPSVDDLDAILLDILPDETGEVAEPDRMSGVDRELNRLGDLMGQMSEGILESLPEDLRAEIKERAAAISEAPVAGPVGAAGHGALAGSEAVPFPDIREGADEPEQGDDKLDIYPVLEEHRMGALDWISASFRPQWRHDRALSAILSELHDLRQDPDRLLRRGRYEIWGVRFRRDILDPDRYVCLALTEKLEGRLRLRLARFNDAPDLRAHHEGAMRLLCDDIAKFEFGPLEALLPGSVAVPPDLMRAGGFEHLQDLPRWYWGADCALWVRKERRSSEW